jgi:hypothetical protein
MSIWQALDDGWRRTLRAPALVVGIWLGTLAIALPLALVLREEIAGHLGSSLAAESAVAGVNSDWWNEFLAQAGGLGQTFVPAIMGFAAVMRNVGDLADAQPPSLVIALALTAHLALTVFLLGGVLDRLARDRAVGTYGFFAACGGCCARLLRLAVVAGSIYWALFGWLHPLLFDRLYPWLVADLTVERTAFAYRAALYAVFGIALVLVNVVVDYAKIRLVVEDRLSALGALSAALRFIRRQPGAVLGLYLLNVIVFLVILGIYGLSARVATSGLAAVLALALGQVYIVLRVIARLTFAASQIALFQSRLAHAGYTARPLPVWPDSAAAEAVRPE